MASEDYVFILRGQHLSDATGQYTEERYCGQIIDNKAGRYSPTPSPSS